MKLRKALATAGVAVGAVAATNELLSRRAEPLEPALEGEQRTYRWRGMDVAYTEAGDPDAPDLLFVHGVNAAASSQEWHEIFEPLSRAYHVVAVDLPGFGRSERPPLVYTAGLYEDFVADFAADVMDSPTILASSLSGSYAATAANRTAVDGLVLVCPTTSSMPGRRKRTVLAVLRSPLLGEAIFNAVSSNPSLEHFSADHGYYDVSSYTQSKQSYQWQTTHQPGARFAPASFVSGYLDPDVDLAATLSDLDVPVTLVWGREADVTPLAEGRRLADATGAKLVVIDYSRLMPHDEHPDKFVEAIEDDLPEISSEVFAEERRRSLERKRAREGRGDTGVQVERERGGSESVEIDVEEPGNKD
ncbi:alpha/beta fold hydrolase [Haloarchaeobius sp. HRN-SO-5]|uniref:alpha/beta fold hydrolase n=1 Tax=Haloarchaeobius sp. HRN-SO-5 TaxID=3446118 RepID=UPI003EBCED98